MRKLISFFFILFTSIFLSIAQNNAENISNIKPISKQEFLKLTDSKEGDIVLIKDEGTIYYFSGSQWYAMKGECFPKPVSPNIDSINILGNKIRIFFNDQNKNVQKYIINSSDSDTETITSNSPAILDKPKTSGNYTYSIKTKNECGMAGPISSMAIEIKE